MTTVSYPNAKVKKIPGVEPPKPITFFFSNTCPYSHRVRITLKEVKAKHEEVEINLQDKPDWFVDVNPTLRVPAIKYGNEVLTESSVVAEFIADLYSETSDILPKDPFQRAQCRWFINYFQNNVTPAFAALTHNSDDEKTEQLAANLYAVCKDLNAVLLKYSPTGPYFLGTEFSIADITAAPFLSQQNILVEIGWLRGVDIPTGPDYARYHQWNKEITSRASVSVTNPMASELVNRYRHLRQDNVV